MTRSKNQHFIFDNQAGDIYTTAGSVIDYINRQITVSEALGIRLKMIIVELLTNAIKHCDEANTNLNVDVSDDQIIITKTDYGSGLALNMGNYWLQWPLPGVHHSGSIIIYQSGNTTLKAEILDNCNLKFFIEETEATHPVDINTISEHFGLMIITQAGDHITYHFNIDNCSNNFVVSITLRS